MYPSVANGHYSDVFYENIKKSKIEINFIFILVKIGLFMQYKVTRIDLMVLGKVGYHHTIKVDHS